MIHTTMILENLILIATVRQHEDESSVDIDVTNNHSGISGKATWTTEQWRAVHLLIANEDEKLPIAKELYEIAEPALKMIPDECRPIP